MLSGVFGGVRLGTATLVATALLIFPMTAPASSLHLYGAGALSVGMAGTHEAIAENYLATWANPANLALNKRVHFGIGSHMIQARFAVDRTGGEQQYPTVLPNNMVLAHLGVSSPIGGIFKNRLGIGIHLHIPTGAPTRIAARDHRTPQVAIYDSIENRLAINMGFGAKVFDWLSVGAAFQLLASLEGRADFSLSILDRRFNRRALHIDLFSSLSPIASILLQPTEDTRVTVTWRSAASVHFKLPVRVDIEQVGKLQFEVEGIGLYTPDQLVLAASQRLGQWTVTAAATWARWSQLPPMAPRIELRIDESVIASGSESNQLIVVRNRPVPMAAKDIIIPRFGAQWHASELVTARAGVRFRPTPLPKADGSANYLDAPAWTFATGISFVLRDDDLPERAPLTIDIGVGVTELQRRTVRKRAANEPVTATSLSGGNTRLALTLHHDF